MSKVDALRAQREARYAEAIRNAKKKPPTPKPPTHCACGAALKKPKRGPQPKFCSPACEQRARRARRSAKPEGGNHGQE